MECPICGKNYAAFVLGRTADGIEIRVCKECYDYVSGLLEADNSETFLKNFNALYGYYAKMPSGAAKRTLKEVFKRAAKAAEAKNLDVDVLKPFFNSLSVEGAPELSRVQNDTDKTKPDPKSTKPYLFWTGVIKVLVVIMMFAITIMSVVLAVIQHSFITFATVFFSGLVSSAVLMLIVEISENVAAIRKNTEKEDK